MPDYSACINTECPQRGQCARYLMKWGVFRQTVSAFSPDTAGFCEHLWPVGAPTGIPFKLVSLDVADDRAETMDMSEHTQ